MLLRQALALIVALLVALPATAQDLKKGTIAHDRGDYTAALREWPPLAEMGNAAAQYRIGLMYRRGQGVLQDYDEAAKWFEKAARQGNAKAQHSLGNSYSEGQGVPVDHTMAVMWFRKAANRGNADSQHSLGLNYAQGQGVPKSAVRAYMWWTLAAMAGHLVADGFRKSVARSMTPAQIFEAERLVEDWLVKYRPKRKLGSF
jgi:TPR repeat protein